MCSYASWFHRSVISSAAAPEMPLEQTSTRSKLQSMATRRTARLLPCTARNQAVQCRPGTRRIRKIWIVPECLLQRPLSQTELTSGHIGHTQVILVNGVLGFFFSAFL